MDVGIPVWILGIQCESSFLVNMQRFKCGSLNINVDCGISAWVLGLLSETCDSSNDPGISVWIWDSSVDPLFL